MMQAMIGAEGGNVSSGVLTQTADDLKQMAEDAIRTDQQELDAALNAVQDNCFRGGHNAQATIDACNALAQQLHEMVKQMADVTRNTIAKNCDYAEKIEREVTPGWESVLEQLKSVHEEMRTLKIDSWQGTASNAYHTKVGTQVNDTAKHIGLSQNARNSIEAVSLVQRGITEQAYSALLNAMSGAQGTVSQSAESFSKGSWFSRGANDQEFSFNFYRRTAAMLNSCAPQQSVLNELAGGNPWRPTSTGIADQLGTALTEARADQEITAGNYDSTVDQVGDEYKSDLDVDLVKIQR